MLLQFLVGVIDTELLECVVLKNFKTCRSVAISTTRVVLVSNHKVRPEYSFSSKKYEKKIENKWRE